MIKVVMVLWALTGIVAFVMTALVFQAAYDEANQSEKVLRCLAEGADYWDCVRRDGE